jgi:hypothetical protein
MEKEIQERLERQRSLSGAEILAVFDSSGFLKIASHDLSEERVSKLLDLFCTAMNDLRNIKSLFPKSKPQFMVANLGDRYIYITSISEGVCLLGAFSTRTGFVKMMQAMESVAQDMRSKGEDLQRIAEENKKKYLSERKRTPHVPSHTGTSTNRLSALQVEAILEEFREELGPAGDIIFNQTASEMGLDPRHLQRDQAIELVHRLANEIENLQRKERFIKTALRIIES